MKKPAILSALFIMICFASFAQEQESLKTIQERKPQDERKEQWNKRERNENQEMQTLLGHNQPGGAYGAFSMGYSSIDDQQAVLFGGKFIWIASHSLGFGFGGTGFINEFHNEPLLNTQVAIAGGYGGLIIEPILMPRYPVHLAFPVLLGAGGVSYVTKEGGHNDNFVDDSEAFLLAEPGAEIELNLTRHFRFAIGTTYRFTTPFNVGTTGVIPVTAKSIEGWTYNVTFKFGRF
jgi:hypothetical protein